MAFFDFVSKAGDYVLGNDEKSVKDQLNKHNLGPDVQAEVQGDKIVLKGTVASQEELEKVILTAGNGEGVAQVGSEIEVATAEPVFYTVERGDNLSKIAKQFYGSSSKYPVIFEANKPMLSHPDKIYPGQKLRIPAID